ncbi:MAG TPA: hypothetical protein VNK95_08335 [Caldilineaceae bacterium]|nr:hypothetical protein [Caldilineaceae bacterium]
MRQASPRSLAGEESACVYASDRQNEQGESWLLLYRGLEGDCLRVSGQVDFWLNGAAIGYTPWAGSAAVDIEGYLLGVVLAYWLELQGIPVVHASAALGPGGVVGFLSHSGHGKSGLAAALMAGGGALLTDDLLPLEERAGRFWGRPGFPTMRMWPDEATFFLGGYEALPRVHPDLEKRRIRVGESGFGRFCAETQPLACLYVPQRRPPDDSDPTISIEPLSPVEAMIELVRHSFVARLAQAVGLQPRRLDFFSRLVRTTPVRRLRYPSGFEHLPRVREAILEDAARLQP